MNYFMVKYPLDVREKPDDCAQTREKEKPSGRGGERRYRRRMKIREGFILREVAGNHVVVPVGKASTMLNGIIRLNNSGVLLWGLLLAGSDEKNLAEKLKEEYGIPEDQAARDVGVFLDSLKKIGCLED